ncbi:MAG: hypothetical protein WBP41_08565 [Saprospiraceae bacterium]
MPKYIFSMLPLLFLLSSFIGFSQHDWTWSIHPEAHFKILAPFELSLSTKELPTSNDPIVYHQYNGGSVSDSAMSIALVIDHYQLPVTSDSADYLYHRELFENAVDQLLTSVKGELIYVDYNSEWDRDICIWKAAYLNGKGVIRGHLIISGNQYYGLQAFGLVNNNPDATMNKFLDSFKIIN